MYKGMLSTLESYVNKILINWRSLIEIKDVVGPLYHFSPMTFKLILDQTVAEIKENKQVVLTS